MIIPGGLMAKLTFPGILVQAKIRERVLGNTSTADYKSFFWITILPLLANSILCIIAAVLLVALTSIQWDGGIIIGIPALIVLWLSISFGMHAFPYKKDATEFWALSNREVKKGNFLGVAGYPIAVVVYVFNLLRFVWIDAVWAIFLLYYTGKTLGVYN